MFAHAHQETNNSDTEGPPSCTHLLGLVDEHLAEQLPGDALNAAVWRAPWQGTATVRAQVGGAPTSPLACTCAAAWQHPALQAQPPLSPPRTCCAPQGSVD